MSQEHIPGTLLVKAMVVGKNNDQAIALAMTPELLADSPLWKDYLMKKMSEFVEQSK